MPGTLKNLKFIPHGDTNLTAVFIPGLWGVGAKGLKISPFPIEHEFKVALA